MEEYRKPEIRDSHYLYAISHLALPKQNTLNKCRTATQMMEAKLARMVSALRPLGILLMLACSFFSH